MAKIYVKTIKDKLNFNWRKAQQLPFLSYDIDEQDYREKSASIRTIYHLDLTAGTYIVLIVGQHENFAGVILTEDHDSANNTYTYKCKDFHVLYRDKFTRTYKKATGRRILTDLLTFNKISQVKTSKKKEKKLKRDTDTNYPVRYLEKFARQLNGMKANGKYEMKNYGAKKTFNPLTKKYKNQKIENKTLWELIKAYTVGTGAFLDLYINDYGTVVIEPFDIDNWRKPKYLITDVYNNMKFKSSTENIVTDVTIEGKNYSTLDITGGKYELNDIFIQNVSSITVEKKTTKKDNKTNQTSNTSFPYLCKNKEAWVNMDLRTDYGSDGSYLDSVCSELEKLGWKVHNMGVGPSIHTDQSKFSQAHDGLWVTIDNGQDCAVFRELANSDWCAGTIASNGAIPCLFFVGISDGKRFTKGGEYYEHLGIAHDDNGNGIGLDYPGGYLAECGVPWGFCGDSAREMAEKINNGGDSVKACQTNFITRKKTGYADNWNWSHEY